MTELFNELIASLPAWVHIAASLAGFLAVGTITSSNALQGSDFFKCDVSASTADTTGTIAHGLGAIASNAAIGAAGGPLMAVFTPKTAADAALSEWRVASINTTNVVLGKRSQSLSAGNAQITLYVMRPHSIGR